MGKARRAWTLLLVSSLLNGSGWSATPEGSGDFVSAAGRVANAAARPYQAHPLAPLRREDTLRWHALLKDGAIYLSLKDAVALTIENNLDIEAARLLRGMARADQLRANAGQLLRNIPPSLALAPSSASGPLAGASAIGYEGLGNSQVNGVLSGLSVQLAGSQIPNLDPILFSSGSFSHTTDPESNRIVTGTNFLLSDLRQWDVGIQKGFLTGTSLDLRWTSLHLGQNAPNNTINPALSADVSLTITQHLLQGFSLAANNRAIRIARNSENVADLLFENQATATVSELVNLYFDLVAFQQQLKVMKDGLEQANRLLADSRRRLDMGLITQSDVTDAQAEASAARDDVASTEVQVLQQELTLKSVISRNGLSDAEFVAAPLILTDRPDEPPSQTKDFGAAFAANAADTALQSRLEIKESEIGLTNKHISLEGTRNALKPSLDVYVKLQNNGLAGVLNEFASPSVLASVDPAFLGSSGTLLDQILRRNYPDYEVGFQLNVPLRNRAAQADMIRDELDLREQQIADQKLHNGIRLQALKSGVAFEQAARQYFAAVETRKFREINYQDEQKAADFGASSVRRLSDARRELQLSELAEITALNTFARAKNNLEAVEGKTWEAYHLSRNDALDPAISH